MSNPIAQLAIARRPSGGPGGIIPTSLDDVFRLAKAVSMSGLAPRDMSTPEQITVAIIHGLELGLPPMQAIQNIAVVNGRPTVWGNAVPALLLSRRFKMREWIEGEGDSRVAWCEVSRPDGGDTVKRKFSVADAKQAKLWQTEAKVKRWKKDRSGQYETDNDSPWYKYPERMLQMRARGFAARDGAADVLGGLYLREEIDEQEMRDVTPKPEKETVVAGNAKALPPVVGDGVDAPASDEPEPAPTDEASQEPQP